MSKADEILDSLGKDKKSAGNKKKTQNPSKLSIISEYLKRKYEIRYNVVSYKIEYRKRESKDKFEFLNENNIYVELERNHFNVSLSKLKALLNSEFVESYDPFANYFNSLPEWHRENEIDFIEVLCTYIPIKDPERFKIQFKKMLVRCIACALDEYVFNKQAFIFVHEQQGSGKTSFCRWLCPPLLKDYIAENINTDKDSQIALATNFIINMDELATMSKIEINTLKSFLSKDKINVRLPYDSRTTIKPRRANFIGSTNKDEFLNDETGSIRWLCFELLDKINFAYREEIDVNNIWRQAFSLYKEGFKYELTADETAENEKVNKQYLINSPEMDLIPQYFKPATKESHDLFLTASNILTEISRGNINIKATSYSVGKAMKILGFQKDSQFSKDCQMSLKGYYVYTIIPKK